MDGSSSIPSQRREAQNNPDDILNKMPFYSQAGRDSSKLHKGLREAKKIEKKKRMILSQVDSKAGNRDLPRYMDSAGIKDTRSMVKHTLEKLSKGDKHVPSLMKLISDPDQKMSLIGCMKHRAIKLLQDRYPNMEIPTLNLDIANKPKPGKVDHDQNQPKTYPDEGSGGLVSRTPRFEYLLSGKKSPRPPINNNAPAVGHYKPKYVCVDKQPHKTKFTKSRRNSVGLPPDAILFLTANKINISGTDSQRSAKSYTREKTQLACSKSVEHEKEDMIYYGELAKLDSKKRDVKSKIIPYELSLKKTLPRIASQPPKSPRILTPNQSGHYKLFQSRSVNEEPTEMSLLGQPRLRSRIRRLHFKSLDFNKMTKPNSIFELTSATGHLDYTSGLQEVEKRARVKVASFVEKQHPKIKKLEPPQAHFIRDFFNNNQDKPRHQKTYSFSRSDTKHLNYGWQYCGPTLASPLPPRTNPTLFDRARLHKGRTHDAALDIQREDWRLIFEGS